MKTPSRQMLQVHPDDDMYVALVDLQTGDQVDCGDQQLVLTTDVQAKHKFACRAVASGQMLKMYGITVGRATRDIAQGELISTGNLAHATDEVAQIRPRDTWQAPDVRRWADQTFDGFHRSDGRVGLRNFWVFVPLVFCQNRNLEVLRTALCAELGYGSPTKYHSLTRQMVQLYQSGTGADELRSATLQAGKTAQRERVFQNVDGVKFLRHELGCGGTYRDALDLCGLLAGYIVHPNVAGATVLSLGCQKSQINDLQAAIHQRSPNFDKPLLIYEQQQIQSEEQMIAAAIQGTIAELAAANELQRQSAPLAHLALGVECGASDGFSGLSANSAIGCASDLLVALGGSVILSEFPELAGCEQNLADRCVTLEVAERFLALMREYDAKAQLFDGGFATNPSPGNIRDGLITDAMKSAGAALKGGTSPVVDVRDYPQPMTQSGLNLLCTPGSDVESTTAMAGSGATIQFFSTGLGTPTGNPVTPVVKVASNSKLAHDMSDIIDVDAGRIIEGNVSIEEVGIELLETMIRVASGELTKAELLGQEDFMPWKRGMSF